jgi:TolB-like protein/Tfp pilus assembly protein PilF
MTQAIFLSYASQDADAARRICDALRTAGLEVWFDQNELRGGDAWDASIRKQIKECALFVPIISHNTQEREEGYFRLEWKLAVDRSHLMADNKAFFFPVILGDVAEGRALVPDKFRERQWTKLNDDVSITAFAARIAKVQAGSASSGKSAASSPSNHETISFATAPQTVAPLQNGAQFPSSTHVAENFDPGLPPRSLRDDNLTGGIPSNVGPSASEKTPSIAVLAFANRSASADDEYFSDGLADELLNVLAKIKGLRVAARTSAFSFKGKSDDIATIGQKLNVATVLEGSVRKSGNRVRISVQLVKVDDGFQLWGETYDRTLDDIFAVQDDIAQAVVQELRTTLLGESAGADAKIAAEIAQVTAARSENPEAQRLVLQARFIAEKRTTVDLQTAIGLFKEALAYDPDYAAAYSGLARALELLASYGGGDAIPIWVESRAAAEAAIARDPNNADSYLALSRFGEVALHNLAFAKAQAEKALALNPQSAEALRFQGGMLMRERKFDLARAALAKARSLDPLSPMIPINLAMVDYAQSRFDEAAAQFDAVIAVTPNWWMPYAHLSRVQHCKGDHVAALKLHVFWLRLRGNNSAADFCQATVDKAGWQGYMAAAVADRKQAGVLHAACAYFHLVLGNLDAAFASWHDSITACEEPIWMLTADPRFEPMCSDSRYAELLKRAGFSE